MGLFCDLSVPSHGSNGFNHFMGVAVLAESSPGKLQRVRWAFYRLRYIQTSGLILSPLFFIFSFLLVSYACHSLSM